MYACMYVRTPTVKASSTHIHIDSFMHPVVSQSSQVSNHETVDRSNSVTHPATYVLPPAWLRESRSRVLGLIQPSMNLSIFNHPVTHLFCNPCRSIHSSNQSSIHAYIHLYSSSRHTANVSTGSTGLDGVRTPGAFGKRYSCTGGFASTASILSLEY